MKRSVFSGYGLSYYAVSGTIPAYTEEDIVVDVGAGYGMEGLV